MNRSPDRVEIAIMLRLAQIDAARGAHVHARRTLAHALQTLAWHRDSDEILRERIIDALGANPDGLAIASAIGHALDQCARGLLGLSDAEQRRVVAEIRRRGHEPGGVLS